MTAQEGLVFGLLGVVGGCILGVFGIQMFVRALVNTIRDRKRDE